MVEKTLLVQFSDIVNTLKVPANQTKFWYITIQIYEAT